jgi:uncharacterized protein YndB with AHSA1/START domain
MTHPPTQPIILEAALDEPPELVWRALTEPELMARWLAPNDIRAEVGRRFTIRPDGAIGAAPIDCEVIEVDPHRLLSYRWRGGEGEAVALDTVVTWVLDPTPEGGTRLRLVHDGFPILVEQLAPIFGPSCSIVDLARRRRKPLTHASQTQRSLKWAA